MRHTMLIVAAVVATGLLLAGGGLLVEKQPVDAQGASRPNIVFVMTDDLDKGSMQYLSGITEVMGSNGTTFGNAYVTTPLCCPSRATFLRGQYAHNHGIIGNVLAHGGGEKKFREEDLDQDTVATWLDDTGYQTAYVGKYMNSYDDLYVPPGWDEWFALVGPPRNYQANDNGQSFPITGHPTDAFADEASGFITRASANPEPFFVFVGPTAPHIPPTVADRYQNSFPDTPLPRPPNFDEADISDKPRWLQAYPTLSQEQTDELEQLYRERLRSMLSVEDLLEQIIATLQEAGELDNTYVFFTSDNGFHMGHHRLYPAGKQTPYEEDVRVPLMVRGPGVSVGALREQLVVNNDLAPTIAELAGAPTPDFVDGSSFAPLLSDSPPSPWRQAFLEEGWHPEVVDLLPPTHKSVHDQGYAFIEYETGEQELYDLQADPYQLESLPRAGNEKIYSELETRLDNLATCSGNGCRIAEWATDTTPPKVVSTVPKANATAVGPTTNVTATFSEGMDSDTVTGQSFRLYKQGSTKKLAAAVSYPAGTNMAKLDPTGPLQEGLTYKAVVGTGAKDMAGNQLDQNSARIASQKKVWSFTVRN